MGLAVVVIALATVALTRGPVSLDPDTPEGTVQEYLVALNEERWDDAIAVIHDKSRGLCQGFELQAFAPGDFSAELGIPSGFNGVVVDEFGVVDDEGAPVTTIPGNRVRVDVTINHHDGGGFGTTWQEHVGFELLFDGDFWWIVGDPWPYFTFSCPGR